MLDNFREIYDQELDKLCSEGAFEHLILSSTEVRMFVYEVCKVCVASQQKDTADAKSRCSCMIGSQFCEHYLGDGICGA